MGVCFFVYFWYFRILQSETYDVLDCIYNDDFSSNTISRYHRVQGSLTWSDGKMIYTCGSTSTYINLRTQEEASTLNLNDFKGKTIKFEGNSSDKPTMTCMIIYYDADNVAHNNPSPRGTPSITVDIPSDITNIAFRLAFNNKSSGDIIEIDKWKIYPV